MWTLLWSNKKKEKIGTSDYRLWLNSVKNGKPLSFVHKIVWNAAAVCPRETWQDFRAWRIEKVVLVLSRRTDGCLHSVCDYFASHNSVCFGPSFYVVGFYCLNSREENTQPSTIKQPLHRSWLETANVRGWWSLQRGRRCCANINWQY